MKGLDLSHSSFSNFIVYVLPLLMYTAYNFIRNKYLVIQNTTRCHLCNPQERMDQKFFFIKNCVLPLRKLGGQQINHQIYFENLNKISLIIKFYL